MFTQGLFLLALALATGAIALINNVIKVGPFTRRTSRQDSALLEFSDQVRYFTENSRDNCRNSLIFKKMTGRHAPIRLINLIFSCYDPHLATYIYSKAPHYIHFERSELENWQIQEPVVVRNPLLKAMLWLMLINSIILGSLSIYTAVVLLEGVQSITAQPEIIQFYAISLAFLLCMGIVAIAYCRHAYQEIAFLDLVKTFYADRPAPSATLIRSAFNESPAKISKRRLLGISNANNKRHPKPRLKLR
ncbi:MAG: hypothetical protein AAGB19_02590 [Cyanobacteria bacterium P01_F01_bin.3]